MSTEATFDMQTLKLKWKDIIGNTSGRIMLSILLFTILLCGGFVTYTYQSKVNAFKDAEIQKLSSIAKSLSVQIDGDKHDNLFHAFEEVDAISQKGQSDFYDDTHEILYKIQEVNQLSTDIYTLIWNEKEAHFEFGITSAPTPYFRHRWKNFSKQHVANYETGGAIGPYADENGVWLSAFMPIKNSEGKTTGLVQVDEPFDAFLAKTNSATTKTIIILLVILTLFTYGMLHVVQIFLNNADKVNKTLHTQRIEIELKNREMLNSIQRAKTIQDSILPQLEMLKKSFPEMFIMFEPKDIVSGDFFWFAEKDEAVYFAVADCTGHGVPGAFMSMMGHSILNEVIKLESSTNPAEILGSLDDVLTRSLQENGGSSSDGMDIAMIRFCKKSNQLDFAGALRPLLYISENKIKKIPGDKHAIGGHKNGLKSFTNHSMTVLPGDTIYLFSDGYYDQFGGDYNKKYMSKNFRDFLLFANHHHIEDQQYLLQYEFHHWRADEDQIDDVLVAGIRFPKAA